MLGGSSGDGCRGVRSHRCRSRTIHCRRPVYRWPDAVLGRRAGGFPTDIRAIYSVGADYLNQGSDIRKHQGVSESGPCRHPRTLHDAHCRFSDIVPPVTTSLEREDVVFPADNYLFYSHQAIDPVPDCRNDYDIFCELADRLGFGEEYSENRTPGRWLESLMAQSGIEDVQRFRGRASWKGSSRGAWGSANSLPTPNNTASQHRPANRDPMRGPGRNG